MKDNNKTININNSIFILNNKKIRKTNFKVIIIKPNLKNKVILINKI